MLGIIGGAFLGSVLVAVGWTGVLVGAVGILGITGGTGVLSGAVGELEVVPLGSVLVAVGWTGGGR